MDRLIKDEKSLIDFSRDILNKSYMEVAELHFLDKTKQELILHDTYRAINIISFYLDRILESFKAITVWENSGNIIVGERMRSLSELMYNLLMIEAKIKSNAKYLESNMKTIKEVYMLTEEFSDFIMMPDGQIFKCNDVSHDMTIALAIRSNGSYDYLRNIIPSDFDPELPIVLDRQLTDDKGILRFHVNPTKDGYIIANSKNINIRGNQMYKIKRNYLYRNAL